MPKTLPQRIIFTALMVFIMVYAMICYNIAIDKGGMTNEIFSLAFMELVIMGPVAFILEFFLVEKLAVALAFRIVNPKEDRQIFIIFAISAMTIALMCPVMSLIAAILFKGFDTQIIAKWVQLTVCNFPMAFFWQFFVAGPLVRLIFRTAFKEK